MNKKTLLSPAVEKVVDTLESEIIFGQLKPREELVEDVLMEKTGAKRHVIRTAIQELVNRRLAVKPRGRSARVIDLSTTEVQEIYEMRELLQREAARIMPLPASNEQLNQLKETHIKYLAAVEIDADKKLIHQLNDNFHNQLFALCGHRELCKAIHYYTEASNPIRSYGIASKDWLQQAVKEHAAMIRAIEQLDRLALKKLVVQHMLPTRQRWEALHGALNS